MSGCMLACLPARWWYRTVERSGTPARVGKPAVFAPFSDENDLLPSQARARCNKIANKTACLAGNWTTPGSPGNHPGPSPPPSPPGTPLMEQEKCVAAVSVFCFNVLLCPAIKIDEWHPVVDRKQEFASNYSVERHSQSSEVFNKS